MTQKKNSIIITPQGLTELQTKLANLVLGLKSDPTELDALAGDSGAQIPPAASSTMPAQAVPRATGWGQEASPSGWTGAAGTPGGGGGGGGSGWGTSPTATGGGTAWGGSAGSGASPSAGGWGTTNAAAAPAPGAWGAGGSGWGTTGSPARNTGWSSPNPQTQSGWNV
jgi:DNA-directed RNA polymerase II subunit RPB3